MKKTITTSILIICMLLVVGSCKEDVGVNEPANDQTTEQKIANNLLVLNGAGNVYADTLLSTQDSISARCNGSMDNRSRRRKRSIFLWAQYSRNIF